MRYNPTFIRKRICYPAMSLLPQTAIDDVINTQYRKVIRKRVLLVLMIVMAIVGSLLLDFTLGPSGLPIGELWQTLIHPTSASGGTRVIVWEIRLPYALMALLVGMALGLAGAEMQPSG